MCVKEEAIRSIHPESVNISDRLMKYLICKFIFKMLCTIDGVQYAFTVTTVNVR